ncbi:MAG TPA: hypothetical protein VMB50_20670 [Myxococcales bacterium]|nr:hypothetical protein [Myxococcales bacterium]
MNASLAAVPAIRPWKCCPCCKAGLTREEWLALPLVGYQQQLGESKSELRNCRCQSTLALPCCYFCDEVLGEGLGSECDCGAIACCRDCGPAMHGCDGDDGRDFSGHYEP